MKNYTVLLLYPDYASENYGQETHMSCQEANGVQEAIRKAQEECIKDNPHCEIENPDHLFCLMVVEGDHMDIKDRP